MAAVKGRPGLGRIFKPDERDALFPLRAVMAAAPVVRPPVRKWSDTWVGNQGSTSKCVGFGSRGMLVSTPYCFRKLTADFIYEGAERHDGLGEPFGPDRGSTVRGAMKFLREQGLIAEFRSTRTTREVLDWLGVHSPIVVGVNWYGKMFEPDLSGKLKIAGQVEGGHCVVLVGYDDKTELVELVNSWGRSWGLRGHGFLSYDDLGRLLREDGEAWAPTKQKFGKIAPPTELPQTEGA